jgi:hypothetical protein
VNDFGGVAWKGEIGSLEIGFAMIFSFGFETYPFVPDGYLIAYQILVTLKVICLIPAFLISFR